VKLKLSDGYFLTGYSSTCLCRSSTTKIVYSSYDQPKTIDGFTSYQTFINRFQKNINNEFKSSVAQLGEILFFKNVAVYFKNGLISYHTDIINPYSFLF